ncbi:MAG: hypothetical protein WBI04_06215 [Trichlorobacter sp.]|jgi:hypothetical protein
MAQKFVEGMFVELLPTPQLGIGKVVKVTSDKISVFFKSQPATEAMLFKLPNNNLVPSAVQDDLILNNLPPFVERPDGKLALPASNTKRMTLAQTLDAFHAKCPLGFNDPLFHEHERDYKWNAHLRFQETLGSGQGRRLLEENKVAELVQRVLSVTSKVNLLSPYENMALHDALQSEQAARKCLTALFCVLDAPVVSEATYQPYIDAVLDLPQEAGKSRVGTWPIVTLLPFIAQPDRHMFLKPTNSQSAAEALSFDLRYQSLPNWRTYEALLEMGKAYYNEIKHLGPRDFIDVQSFIWMATHT